MLFSPFVLSCLYSLVAFGPLTSAQTILTTGPLATATPNLTSTTGATSLLATTTGVQLSSATSASVYTSAPSSRGESSPVLLSRYLQQSDVRVQNGYTVIEIPGTIEDPAYAALCWYPVSVYLPPYPSSVCPNAESRRETMAIYFASCIT